MSGALGPFRDGPQWNVMTDYDVLDRARNLPVGYGEMALETVKESFLKSAGLGTAIREAGTPDSVSSRDVVTPPELDVRDPLALPQIGEDAPVRFAPPAGAPLETEQEYQQRRKDAGALSKEEWEASTSFRPKIPYDPGMTAARAAALASWYDASEARQAIISRGPGGFLGNSVWFLAGALGSAPDPVNYIPIFGPEVRAAQIARFGRIGGAAATSAAEGAVNTAIMGGLTAGMRNSFGDDVTWHSYLTDVAIGAVLGGAFGAATSGWQGWKLSRSANEVQAVAAARAALNDTLHDVLHGKPVEITPTVADAVERAATKLEPERVRIARENPGEVIGQRLREAAPDLVDRDANLAQAEKINREHLDEINSELSGEQFSAARRAMIEAGQAADAQAAKLSRLEAGLAKTDSEKQRVKLQEQIDALRAEAKPATTDVDPAVLERMQFLEESARLRRQNLDAIAAQRAEVTPALKAKHAEVKAAYLDEARTAAKKTGRVTPEYLNEIRMKMIERGHALDDAELLGVFPDGMITPDDMPVPAARRAEAAAPRAETPDPSVIKAASDVGKRPASAAAEFGMDKPQTFASKPEPQPEAEKVTRQKVSVIRGENGRIVGAEIAKPAKELADQFGIDGKSGGFPEMAEFEQLVAQGRVTPDELEAMRVTTEIQAQADHYARALEAAAICRVGA